MSTMAVKNTACTAPIVSFPVWLNCRYVFARLQYCTGMWLGNGELRPTMWTSQPAAITLLASLHSQICDLSGMPWTLLQVSISNFKDFFDDYRGLFSSMLVKLQCVTQRLYTVGFVCFTTRSVHLLTWVSVSLRNTLGCWNRNATARSTSSNGS